MHAFIAPSLLKPCKVFNFQDNSVVIEFLF